MTDNVDLSEYLESLVPEPELMPVLFIGHGSPMNAIEKNEFTDSWREIGCKIPQPKAILCISAHWETKGIEIQTTECPKTIYDFYGFPEELFNKRYPAPGATEVASETFSHLMHHRPEKNNARGFDHGVWSVLLQMYPGAQVPVFQLSLSRSLDFDQHFSLGAQLAFFRKKGVLILCSGNIVHNLAMSKYIHTAYDWAIEFDAVVKNAIRYEEYSSLIHFKDYGAMADLSIPTNEHYLPMLYALALKEKKDDLIFFNEKNILASVSMRSFIFGRLK